MGIALNKTIRARPAGCSPVVKFAYNDSRNREGNYELLEWGREVRDGEPDAFSHFLFDPYQRLLGKVQTDYIYPALLRAA